MALLKKLEFSLLLHTPKAVLYGISFGALLLLALSFYFPLSCMPTTSTIPPELKQLLKSLKTCLLDLHRKTEIPRARLVEINETWDPTQAELYALLKALGPHLVDNLAAALGKRCADQIVNGLQMQSRIVNQNGYRNKPCNNLNYYNYNHVHLHLTGVSEPEPKAMIYSPQNWEAQQVQPNGQVRQIGQSSAVRELERAE